MFTIRVPFLLLLLVSVSIATSVIGAESTAGWSTIRVIHLDSRGPSHVQPAISSVAIDPPKGLLAVAGDDHLVRLFEADCGEQCGQLKGHSDWVRVATFSPDGRYLVTAGDDQCIRIWEVATKRLLQCLPDEGAALRTLVFSPDGQMLAAGDFEGRIRLYRSETRQLLHTFKAPCRDIRALAFSPNGQQLAAGGSRLHSDSGNRGLISIWDTSTKKIIHQLESARRINTLAYRTDGIQLSVAGEGRTVQFWDPQAGTLLGQLPVRPAKILALTYCGPERLAVGGTDNVIRIWDLAKQTEAILRDHTGSISSLAWDDQNGVLWSGSFDTTVRAWHMSGKPSHEISWLNNDRQKTR